MQEELFSGPTPAAPGNQLLLERPRIDRLLEKAVESPVVAVIAGAGYGKTCAVYSFARKCNARTAWIQCSERDNVGERFWENFISTVYFLNHDTAAKLRQIDFPATPQQFDHYLEIARSDIIPNEKYFLVYDDLHLITDRTVLRFLEHSIMSVFPNITTILVSRTEPALNLAKPNLKKIVSRITEDDIRFSLSEMVSYFELQEIRAAPQTASAIYHETEGWAIAINLAGITLKNVSASGSQAAAYVSRALRSNAFKLIESEFMAGLSPDLRRFLIKLSLIENHSAELLLEIGNSLNSDKPNASSLFGELEKLESFVRYDKYTNAYHIHHLFLDYLREKQNELSEEERKDTLTRAAIWCTANNQKTDAIIYYDKAGDYDSIIKIFSSLPLLMPAQMARFVHNILKKLPGDFYLEHPEAIEIRTRTLNSLGLYGQSKMETLEILRRLNEPGVIRLAHSCGTYVGKHRMIMFCYLNLGFVGLIQATRTKCYDFIDYFRMARDESKKAGYAVLPPVNGINISSYACRIMAPATGNDIEEYIAALGEIIPCTSEAMGGCQYGMYELARGEYAFFLGKPGEAEEMLQKSVVMSRERQQHEIENRSLFYLLRIYLSRGNAAGLERTVARLKEQTEEPFFPNRFFYHDIVMGWYYIQTGRKDMTASWLKSDYEEGELNNRMRGLEKLVKAKYFFAEKRYPAALASLESLEEAEPLLFGDIEMKALEAVCRYHLQEKEKAYRALETAYALASPAGLFMPFTELGKDMRALAGAALKDMAAGRPAPELNAEWLDKIHREAAIYAKRQYRLKRAMPGYGQTGKKGKNLLSHREIQVLTGLSQGLTREEIAGSASISPNTVKSATRSIYNKLGALNQADAVRIATERGIL